MAETWRVVLASGEVREVEVSRAEASGMLSPVRPWHGWRAARTWDGPVHAASEAMGDSAEEACARLAVGNGLAAREILAPGEPTRAELIAERDEARAELARPQSCEGYFADRDRDAAWTAGAEAMREAILDELPCVSAERDECAARMHRVAIPVPQRATKRAAKAKPARLVAVPEADELAIHGETVIVWQPDENDAWDRVWTENGHGGFRKADAWTKACEGHRAREYNRGGRCTRDSADEAAP